MSLARARPNPTNQYESGQTRLFRSGWAEIENASDNSERSCRAVRHSPLLIDVPLRIGGLVSGQTRLVTELYSQGQAYLVLAQLSLVQPVNFSMASSKSLEVAPPARKSTYNCFNSH